MKKIATDHTYRGCYSCKHFKAEVQGGWGECLNPLENPMRSDMLNIMHVIGDI